MKTFTLSCRTLPLLAASVCLVGAVHAAPGDRSVLAGSAPSWANSRNFVSSTDPSTDVGFRVYLGWNNSAAATALAAAVSDPKSPSYGHYLQAAQFRKQFAPAASQVTQVQNWLRAQGFSVQYTPTNGHYVSAEGSVAQLQATFGVSFGNYLVRGQLVRAPSGDVSIPASLADVVRAIVGLDESYQFVQTQHRVDADALPSAGFRNASPLSDYWAQLLPAYAFPTGYTDLPLQAAPWAVKGYTPSQIKGAYDIPACDGNAQKVASCDGTGQTVAIIDAYASPTILQDVNQWSVNRGLPTMTPAQLVQVVPPGIYRRPQNPRQDPRNWYGEETLDVEAVHGMAPGARIVYVGAPNNYQDLDAALNHVVDEQLAHIVTNSYGFSTELLPPGYILPLEDTLVQAAIEGIGVYFSSGDNGDESPTAGSAAVDWPASSPWVTAVGGTSLAVSDHNTRVFETGWGTGNYPCNPQSTTCTRKGWLYGSGGGVSVLFAEPDYQRNAGLNLTGRGVPDVAALGDPQLGLLVGQTQTFPDGTYYGEYRIGGTSLSSPVFAGLMALVDQKAGHPHGFANPLFYENPSAFYDVVSVKTAVTRRNYVDGVDSSRGTADFLRTLDDYSGSPIQHTSAGWDNVTGLGAPGVSFLTLLGK